MTNLEDKEKRRLRRNLVAKDNKYKPKAQPNRKVYKRTKFDLRSATE